MNYKYHRVLVSYALSQAKDSPWSTLHWCDIEQDEDGLIQIRVAPAGAHMPTQETFRILEASEYARIRVIDLSNDEARYYCLSLTNTTLRRFEISSYGVLQSRGKKWSPEVVEEVWSEQDMIQDTTMRGSSDYLALTALSKEQHFSALQQQYRAYLVHLKPQKTDKDNSGTLDISAPLPNLWLNTRDQPVTFTDYQGPIHSLNEALRKAIQTVLSTQLTYIKQNAASEDAYGNALCYILNRKAFAGFLNNPEGRAMAAEHEAVDHEFQYALREFDARFLHPNTLKSVYPNFYQDDIRQKPLQPLRKQVHDYTLDLVFHELKQFKLQYRDQTFEREACPKAYASQRIDDTPPPSNQHEALIVPAQRYNKPKPSADKYLTDLLQNNITVIQVLSDENVIQNPDTREKIIDFLKKEPWLFENIDVLLDTLELLSPAEVEDIFRVPSILKRVEVTISHGEDRPAFVRYARRCPVLLTILSNSLNPQIQLAVLNATIQRIKPEYSELARQANRVLADLDSLPSSQSVPVTHIIRLTLRILGSAPGNERNQLLKAYMNQANHLSQYHPAQVWKQLGNSMILLGAAIAAIGCTLLLTGVVAPTFTAGILVTGTVMSVAGMAGFFYHRSRTLTLHTFAEEMRHQTQPLF